MCDFPVIILRINAFNFFPVESNITNVVIRLVETLICGIFVVLQGELRFVKVLSMTIVQNINTTCNIL